MNTPHTTGDALKNISLPDHSAPTPMLPPGIGPRVKIPGLTAQIPPGIRNLIRYGQQVNKLLPHTPGSGIAGKTQIIPVSHVDSVRKPVRRHDGPLYSDAPQITRGTLVNFDAPTDIMTFQFNPESVNVSLASGWVVQEVPGRIFPFVFFGAGGQKKITFQLKMYYAQHTEKRDILGAVKWLQSFQISKYSKSLQHQIPPSVLMLHMGQLFSGVCCILLKADAEYKDMFDPTSLRPNYAEIDIELLEIGRRLATQSEDFADASGSSNYGYGHDNDFYAGGG